MPRGVDLAYALYPKRTLRLIAHAVARTVAPYVGLCVQRVRCVA